MDKGQSEGNTNQDYQSVQNQSVENPSGGGMRKYAKGGMAITISASPGQDARQRSGSKPRQPFDLDPFHGNLIPDRANSNEKERDSRDARRDQRNQYRSNMSSQERIY